MRSPESVNVLGVPVSAVDLDLSVATIEGWIARREQHYVCVTSVHGVMECHDDHRFRHVYEGAGLVTPDGMPLVWFAHARGYGHVRRVYGPDLMLVLCQRSIEKGYRHFLYGGGDGVADRLAAELRRRFPGLAVVGGWSPPFRPLTDQEERDVVAMIDDRAPDIVWVGLSTPKQEWWMATHVGRMKAPVLIGVGAAFDFHAGLKKQAPRWMQRSGLEWTFRLATEPRRLWRRYLTNNPRFLVHSALQLSGLRRYE